LRRDQHWKKTNVLQSAPQNQHAKSKPVPNEVKKHFKFYLIDLIKCPDAVKAYLCARKHLHNVPVLEEGADLQKLQLNYSKFFIGKRMYTVIKSRYSDGHMTNVDDVSQRKVRFLGAQSEDEEVERLEKEIAEQKQEMEVLTRKRVDAEAVKKARSNEMKNSTDLINKVKEKVKFPSNR